MPVNQIRGQRVKTYAVAIAIPLAVGLFSALLTRDSMMLYGDLRQPPLAPPAWLFPVVWTILYVLMGVSSGMIWERREEDPETTSAGLSWYALSLGFNFLWSILFFSCRRFLLAFFWLLGLLFLIVRTVLSYRKLSKTAAWLQIPYLIWVSFAGYLNFAIWYLNR